jgi:hypothetical protein
VADDEGDGDAVGTGAIGSSDGTGTGVVLGVTEGSGEAEMVGSALAWGVAVATTSLSGVGVSSSAIVGASRKITKVKAKINMSRISREILRMARFEKLKLIVLSIRSINLSSNMSKY